jgi:hypothetical protein
LCFGFWVSCEILFASLTWSAHPLSECDVSLWEVSGDGGERRVSDVETWFTSARFVSRLLGELLLLAAKGVWFSSFLFRVSGEGTLF